MSVFYVKTIKLTISTIPKENDSGGKTVSLKIKYCMNSFINSFSPSQVDYFLCVKISSVFLLRRLARRSTLLPNKEIKTTILKSTTQLKYSTYFSTEEGEVLPKYIIWNCAKVSNFRRFSVYPPSTPRLSPFRGHSFNKKEILNFFD